MTTEKSENSSFLSENYLENEEKAMSDSEDMDVQSDQDSSWNSAIKFHLEQYAFLYCSASIN